jgi:hypothetical protein
MKSKLFKNTIRIIVFLFILLIILGGSYTWWNAASPERTCAGCHEISPSHTTWTASAHREISCFKCHGTALENGWHSLSEKSRMVVRHIQNKPHPDEIRLSEAQIFETMDRCFLPSNRICQLAGRRALGYLCRYFAG